VLKALHFDNNVFVIGNTPEQADIQDLIEWLESKKNNDVFYTDSYQKFTRKQRNLKMSLVDC